MHEVTSGGKVYRDVCKVDFNNGKVGQASTVILGEVFERLSECRPAE